MGKAKAKENSSSSKEKEDSTKEKEKNDQCKSMNNESFTSCHPSNPGSCRCGASMDYTVSSIPWSADWPVNFPLQSATEYVSAMGLHPETIISRLSKKLSGRLAYSEDSYRTIDTSERHINVIRKGYKPTWDKYAPWQRVAPSTHHLYQSLQCS